MSKSPRESVTVKISLQSVLMIVVVGLVVLALFKVFDLVLVVLTAVVISAFIDSLAAPLMRLRIPRVPAVGVVYLTVFFAFGGLLYLIIPVFVNEITDLVTILPEDGFVRTIVQLFGDFTNAKQALSSVSGGSTELFMQARNVLGSVSGDLFNSLSSVFGGIVNTLLIIVISLYLAVQERGIEKFLQAITPVHREAYVISLWRRTERKIGLWFRGQLLSALIIAVLTYGGLLLLGVPYAFILALVAGMFGLIPFGIIVATIPAVMVAFFAGGFQLAVLVIALYLVLQQIEEYVLHPLIINKVTGVPSLVILLSLVVAAKLAGFLGLFLGLPAAIMLIELVNDFESRKLKQMEVQ